GLAVDPGLPPGKVGLGDDDDAVGRRLDGRHQAVAAELDELAGDGRAVARARDRGGLVRRQRRALEDRGRAGTRAEPRPERGAPATSSARGTQATAGATSSIR